jgi:hypothetical protein
MLKTIVDLLNRYLERNGYKPVVLQLQPPTFTERDEEFNGWYGYLRLQDDKARDEVGHEKTAKKSHPSDPDYTYYDLTMAFAIQDRLIEDLITIPLPEVLKSIMENKNTEQYLETLAKMIHDHEIKELDKRFNRKMTIKTTFPGQKEQVIDVPDHIKAHFMKTEYPLPFIEVIWD